ncbi:hypothetical protein M758_3G035700 [Ceratodon purpureus]|nr:hypothetical protein M758_3G035700 [Ceratodon purpureus]
MLSLCSISDVHLLCRAILEIEFCPITRFMYSFILQPSLQLFASEPLCGNHCYAMVANIHSHNLQLQCDATHLGQATSRQ